MDVPTAISLASFIIALLALFIALLQVQVQFSIDSRRKGKTDHLALGSWAISWPQTKLFIHHLLHPLGLRSPWGDPRLLTVPIITVRAIEEYLINEARATQRKPIERRIYKRLVDSVTSELASGAPAFQRHMYAVRWTTRKRSESCWTDIMDMCGFERKHWHRDLLTQASAPGCDGVVRPANAVTNIHSLTWYARIMGLRDAIQEERSVIFCNVGAKLYYERVHQDNPVRLAHFQGSPGGRYMILEEMSQATGQSVYADSVWAYGGVPVHAALEVHWPPKVKFDRDSPPRSARQQILWPDCVLELRDVDINGWPWPSTLTPVPGLSVPQSFVNWAMDLLQRLNPVPETAENSTINTTTELHITQFATYRLPALISCIRTYPVHRLSTSQIQTCQTALFWCIKHHWLSPYYLQHKLNDLRRANPAMPFLPTLDCSVINCEYITGTRQADEWCKAAFDSPRPATMVDKRVWESCCALGPGSIAELKALNREPRRILLRVLQTWKLCLLYVEKENGYVYWGSSDVVTALLALLTMASVALADDPKQIALGPTEENKVLEVELG